MPKIHPNAAAVVLLSASIAVIFVFIYNRIGEVNLPQFVYSAIGVLYLLAYVISLYFVFASDRVKKFRFGWTVLLLFLGMILFPVFWYRHLRAAPSPR